MKIIMWVQNINRSLHKSLGIISIYNILSTRPINTIFIRYVVYQALDFVFCSVPSPILNLCFIVMHIIIAFKRWKKKRNEKKILQHINDQLSLNYHVWLMGLFQWTNVKLILLGIFYYILLCSLMCLLKNYIVQLSLVRCL